MKIMIYNNILLYITIMYLKITEELQEDRTYLKIMRNYEQSYLETRRINNELEVYVVITGFLRKNIEEKYKERTIRKIINFASINNFCGIYIILEHNKDFLERLKLYCIHYELKYTTPRKNPFI